MIQHRFHDQKITLDKLIDDRIRLLNELIRESAENNFPFKLEEYQHRLQMLKYAPHKLISCTNGEKASAIMLSDVSVPEVKAVETGWEFFNHDIEVVETANDQGWNLAVVDNNENIETIITNLKWDIDMREHKDILSLDRTQAYFDITL